MNRETELAWAAGFFEGEGCVSSAVTRGKLRIRASVVQHEAKGRDQLERFVAAVGLGKVLGPYNYTGRYAGSPTQTERYVIQYQSAPAVDKLIRLLTPYLTEGSPKLCKYFALRERANTPEARGK